jgi:selenocysteine lyase/cysteine desulfurase
MSGPWEEVRRDFPAVSRYVYLNAAAASPTPLPVREAVASFQRDLEEQGDLPWERWLEKVEEIRAGVARFVGAAPDEIAFVPNTSAGINLIVDALAEDGPVLSGEREFPTVTLPWLHRGVAVHFMPEVEGVLRLESFVSGQAPRAATICVSHVQFGNGCRQDLDRFGDAKDGRALVVCGSQSIGAFPVDVKRSRIDALATAGHKWLAAGYGAGFCYLKRELVERRPPRAIGWLSGTSPYLFDNRRIELKRSHARTELGCPPFAQIFALGAAVHYVSALGIEAVAERVLALNMYLTSRLTRRGFEVLSPGGEHRSGSTLVALPDPPHARAFLADRGVLVTEKPEGVRVSTHFYNNEQDVDACLDALIAYRSTRS